jgi:hypothetical protein
MWPEPRKTRRRQELLNVKLYENIRERKVGLHFLDTQKFLLTGIVLPAGLGTAAGGG